MSNKKTWFNWHCPRCHHCHKISFVFQFKIPNRYEAEWICERCENKSLVVIDLQTYGWYKQKDEKFVIDKKKAKRERKKKVSVEKEDDGTQKDRGYTNHKI